MQSSSEYERELNEAKKAASEAGRAIMEIYGTGENWEDELDVIYKEQDMPLTRADQASDAIITRYLKSSFPEYALLSEEQEDNEERLANPYCFVVDPLDGTKEFIKRNGQFTVNIALSYQNEVVMGVIQVPVSGALYYAAKGYGAYVEEHGVVRRLQVSDRTEDFRVVMSGSHGCREMEEMLIRNRISDERILRMGSSLKGCLIAQGDAEVYYRHNPTMEWDTAAMQCIVEEAGGIFREMDGSLMRYNRSDCTNRKGFYILNCKENDLQG